MVNVCHKQTVLSLKYFVKFMTSNKTCNFQIVMKIMYFLFWTVICHYSINFFCSDFCPNFFLHSSWHISKPMSWSEKNFKRKVYSTIVRLTNPSLGWTIQSARLRAFSIWIDKTSIGNQLHQLCNYNFDSIPSLCICW